MSELSEDAAGPLEAEAAARALLAHHPDALVFAVGDDALFVPIPDSLPIGGHRVGRARSGLDLVQVKDRVAVIDGWELARAEGGARIPVHLAGDVPTPGILHFFDLNRIHGVYLGVLVATGVAAERLDEIAQILPRAPRLARTRKNERSFLIEVSDEVTAMLGWAPEEMVGQRSLDFIHPDDHERAIDSWMETLCQPGATGRSRLRHRRRDGEWTWLEISNRNLLDDPAHGFVECDMLDISDEMSAIEAMQASEELLRRLAEALPVGVLRIDETGGLVFANEELYRIVGAESGASGPRLLDSIADRSTIQAVFDQALAGTDADVQIHVDRLDGSGRRRCTLALRALTTPDGQVTGAVGCVTDVTDSVRMSNELEQRATYDALTGCVNRAAMMSILQGALDDPGGGTAVIFLDLDGFKAVNDQHGHGAGDTVLITVAARLRDAVRGADVVGRLGGDEFLVICPDVADPAAALALGERVAAHVAGPLDLGAGDVPIRPSVGVAWSAPGDRVPDGLIARADAAMYQSKREHAGRTVVAGHEVERRRAVPGDVGTRLRRALTAGEFELHFQEVFVVATGAMVGTEALLRWRRDGALVPAVEFIAAAEATGAMCDIGPWVVDEVFRQAAAARRPDLKWFLNLSPRELAAPKIVAAFTAALDRHGTDPASIVVEITEHANLVDGGAAGEAINAMAAAGVGVALDDFGTGWSSLSTLLAVPARWLKIDRRFTQAAACSQQGRAIVGGVVDLAARIGAQTIAEGVETVDELAAIQALGVTHGQGYLLSRPRPLEEVLTGARVS